MMAIVAAIICCVAGLMIFYPAFDENQQQANQTAAINVDLGLAIKQSIAEATELVEKGRFEEAEKIALVGLQQSPGDPDLLLLAARAAGELQKIEAAIEYCDRVSTVAGPQSEIAAWVPCELLFRNKHFQIAEERTKMFLERYPNRADARQRLVYLLNLSGRNFEASPHLLYLIQQRQFGIEALLFLSDVEKVVDYSDQLNPELIIGTDSPNNKAPIETATDLHIDDSIRLLGLAKISLANGRYAEAEKLLDKLLVINPGSVEGNATLGELYYETGRFDELDEWEKALSGPSLNYPATWLVKGLAARDTGQPEWAVRYFWEAIRRAPTNRRILFALGRELDLIGKGEEAKRILALHQDISEYVRTCERMYRRKPELNDMMEAARFCDRTGRLWEAWGWTQIAGSQIAESISPGGGEVAELATNLLSRLQASVQASGTGQTAEPGQVVLDDHPATMLNINSIEYPARERFALNGGALNGGALDRPNLVTRAEQTSEIRFVDDAARTNFLFAYFDAADPLTEGKRIYEFGGGGVGAIDIDRDGFVDVYLTQGCSWPPGSGNDAHQNSLKRNLNGESFLEIAEIAGVHDRGFGQGVAIGDINGDGFSDIYVANIGANRLFLNSGDGTFLESTEQAIKEDEKWTTSCLIADLNGDGNPDIYDVNYLQGENIFDRICVWEGQRRRICGPATFQPAQDRMLIGSGGAEFDDVTESSGIKLPGGTGLGIIAGDLQGSGNIDLFVANDQHKNFYLSLEKGSEPNAPKFADKAVISGLAFDANGLAQACMGVAAGDADGNGLTDLFITNFYRESNTLYTQESAGYFTDVARTAGLKEPSYEMLGFGTQFLDLELDGHLDLVLTNGHLDDFTYLKQPYEMPPQVYRNSGNGTFQLLSGGALGEFFLGLYRGRSLARLDWNRDGAEDFIVAHLDRPTSLLTNRSERRGRSITLELVGVESSRDAVGASVSLTVGDRRLTRSVFAGDGYQASNERILVFGLGDKIGDQVGGQKIASEVVVRWPSGHQQRIESPLMADGRYLVIEDGRVVRLFSVEQ